MRKEVAGSEAPNDVLQRAAVAATDDLGGDVMRVDVSEGAAPVAAVIRYRAKDANQGVPVCSISVVEGLPARSVVVTESNALIACPLADASIGREQITLTVKGDSIHVSNDSENGSSTFDLQRFDGEWYVTEASFTHTEADPATGDIVVVNEMAKYSPESRKVRVSDYTYDAIRSDLISKTIE